MDQSVYKQIREFGKTKANASLAKYTTFKIGGEADLLVEVEDRKNLSDLVLFLDKEGIEYFLLGGGSNVLLPDDRIEKVIIRNKTAGVSLSNMIIEADSGLPFGLMTNLALKGNLSGLEWSAGLPGTVGGAVRGNAGAAGGQTAEILTEAEVLLNGEIVRLKTDECKFGYRDSIFKHTPGVVLRGWFKLFEGDAKSSLSKMQEIISKRSNHYPQYPCAGSFFKNVPLEKWKSDPSELPAEFVANQKIPAGWLIDKAGLKGKICGGAMVSNEHGNFLINYKNATQKDMLTLVEEVKTTVYNKFNVGLEEEVQIVF